MRALAKIHWANVAFLIVAPIYCVAVWAWLMSIIFAAFAAPGA